LRVSFSARAVQPDGGGLRQRGMHDLRKRIYRSRDERMIAGVAGGLANYLDIDPSIMRILWLVAFFGTGPVALLVYLVCAIIIPSDRDLNLI
jgi:phage shock protein PspC (stress-responsive transcriptional regulator)